MHINKDFCRAAISIFNEAIEDYHVRDNIDAEVNNPYPFKSIKYNLYLKCWIDTVQWHMEDIMRDPQIDPEVALKLKRRIDRYNQDRTDLVELIDSYFWDAFEGVTPAPDATLNTESPAWAIDRLSILQLKIYHMRVEAERPGITDAQRSVVNAKLYVLIQQNDDLVSAIDTLLEDLLAGRKQMKLYKQMKMYNDPTLNPVLYRKNTKQA
ncbi:MAG: DUF4254 domain-containing protein [Porphyromonas sp.]|nr:DUF4254 domain-containing protein [Porphyromonas sp.]